MYATVVKLKDDELEKFFDEDSSAKAVKALSKISDTPTQNFSLYLSKLLRGLDKGNAFSAVNDSLTLVMKCKLKGKEAADTIQVISKELPKFSDRALSSFVKELTEVFEDFGDHDGKVFEVLARCMSRLGTQEGNVELDGESLTRSDFKSQIINRLVESQWSPKFTVNLLSSFRELGLSEEEQKKLSDKGVAMLNEMEEDVPFLVYQLLLFSPKDKGGLVVSIAQFFEKKERDVRGKNRKDKVEALWQSEGRVLLHVDMALKQDPSLAGAFLKKLQKDSFSLTSFMLAFLLSLSNSARHQDSVMKLLMTSMQSWVQDEFVNSAHEWANEARAEQRSTEPLDIVLRETVNRAKHGWHAIIQPLMTLAFTFMEAKTKAKKTSDRLKELASDLLIQIFTVHETFQSDVLTQVLSRISTTAAEASVFIELFSKLVKSHPHQIAAFESQLKEAFDYLTYLKPAIGLQLVEAVIPLLVMSKSFQDHLMIVFRKTMFRGDLSSRLTAVGGFARWITLSKSMEESLSHEILGFLNRGLTQQVQVRSLVYASLEGMLRNNLRKIEIQKQVMHMLNDQLDRYIVKDTVVNLELCLDGDCIMEPIGSLLAVSNRCIALFQSKELSNKDNVIREKVRAFVRNVEDSDIEDYGLDKGCDFSEGTGKANLAKGSLLLSLYVSCMECIISSDGVSLAEIKRVIRLFKKHSELQMMMQSGGNAALPNNDDGVVKKRKKGAASSGGGMKKFVPMLVQHLGLDAVKKLFFALAKPNQDNVSQLMRDEREFHLWIISHLLQVVSVLFEPSDNAESLGIVSVGDKLEFCDAVGGSVMCEYKRDSGSLNTVVAEILFAVVGFVVEAAHGDVERVVTFLDIANPLPKQRNASSQAQLLAQLKTMLSFVPPLIEAKNHKEMLLLLNLCDCLIKLLKRENADVLVKTLKNLLKEEVENVVAVKAMVTLYLDISEKNNSLGHAALSLAEQINNKLGRIDEEEEVARECEFNVITEKTWSPVSLLCLGVCEKYMEEIDWAVAIIKGNESTADFSMEKLRTLLYNRTSEAIAILDELSKTNASWSGATESLLRNCTRFFKELIKLTKISAAQKHIPSQGFVDNIRGVGGLIRDLYDLMEHVKDNDTEGNELQKKKNKIQAAARAKREGKILPALVFEIERLEASVLKYQTQCRVTLMSDWRRSAERDFKLDPKKMTDILKRRLEEEGEEEEAPDKDDRKKKSRKVAKDKEEEEEEEEGEEEEEDGGKKKQKKRARDASAKKGAATAAAGAVKVKKTKTKVASKQKAVRIASSKKKD